MDPRVAAYRSHTPYSDPGAFRERWQVAAGADAAAAGALARNLLYHYRADGIDVPEERRGDIDSRWVERILGVDASRHPEPVDVPREKAERVAGCCRDFTQLTISILREQGVPARGRVGFAGYLGAAYHYDHVVAEWWNGERWVRSDAQLEPTWFAFDTTDLPREGLAGFSTAAEVWSAIRRDEADPRTFGVFPESPYSGLAFVFDYVIRDVAHLHGDELLLWDVWGGMIFGQRIPADAAAWMDELAALVIALDAGEQDAVVELAERYATDARLAPRGTVVQASPFGLPDVVVDLVAAAPSGAARTLAE